MFSVKTLPDFPQLQKVCSFLFVQVTHICGLPRQQTLTLRWLNCFGKKNKMYNPLEATGRIKPDSQCLLTSRINVTAERTLLCHSRSQVIKSRCDFGNLRLCS